MTNIKVITISIAIIATLSGHSVAQENTFDYETGSDYVQNCSGARDLLQIEPSLLLFLPQVLFCYSYTLGFIDGWTYMSDNNTERGAVCVPEKVTMQQSMKIVVKYIEDHPEREHEATAVLIPDALFDVFPCLSEDNQE